MKTIKNLLNILVVVLISINSNAQNEDKKTGCVSGDCENGYGKYIYSISPEKHYEGNFKDGTKEGKGIFYDEGYNSKYSKKYVGEFKNNVFHGKGTLTYLGTYEGDFAYGLMHGKGVSKSKYGTTFEGEYMFDERYKGTFIYKDGSKYIGEYMNGKRNGQGKYYDKNGKLLFEGRYRNRKPIYNATKGKKTHEIGIYEGEFVNDLADGYGIFTMKDGSVYKGTFKEDKAHGYGVMTAPNGMKYEGQFKDDKFNGYGTLTNPDGSKRFGEWKDNKIYSLIEEYDKNGKIIVKEKKKSNGMFELKWD